MNVLEWTEPPASEHTEARTAWDDLADQLHARPGEWARVAEGVTTSAKSTYRRSLNDRGCEVRQHKTGPDCLDIYARARGNE